MLADISDRLQSLEATLVAVNGGKPGRWRPAARPETEVHRARERMAQRRYEALVDDVKAAQARHEALKGREVVGDAAGE